MLRFSFFLAIVALLCTTGGAQASSSRRLGASNKTPMNSDKMLDFFATFIEAKQSFMLSKECQNNALDKFFTEQVTMFTDKSEFIKAPSGDIRETFHNHCVGLKKKYGAFKGFEYEVHSFEGNYQEGRGEFHGTTLMKSKFSDSTIEEYERFSYVVNLESDKEKKGTFSEKPHWKITHLHTSKPA